MESSTLSIRELECVYHGMVIFQNQFGCHKILIPFWEEQVRTRCRTVPCSNHDSSITFGGFSSAAACLLFHVIGIDMLPGFL